MIINLKNLREYFYRHCETVTSTRNAKMINVVKRSLLSPAKEGHKKRNEPKKEV